MLFNIVNNGKGPRIVRTAGRRAVVVHPGEKNAVDLHLDPETAAHLSRMEHTIAKNASSLSIRAKDDMGRRVLNGTNSDVQKEHIPGTGELIVRDAQALADTASDAGQSPYDEEGESAPAAPSGPKKELLERADTLDMDELRLAVRETLGDDAPRELDRLKRVQIMRLLKE